MRVLFWILRHPVLTIKILVCSHDHIDLKSLKCKWCGKQYRFISASEYVSKVASSEPLK